MDNIESAIQFKIVPEPLGVVVLSPDRKQDIGLRRVGKLADDAHEPVWYLLQKKPRIIMYKWATGQAGHVKIKLADDWVPVDGWNFCVITNSINGTGWGFPKL